jgi:hypothetical protein
MACKYITKGYFHEGKGGKTVIQGEKNWVPSNGRFFIKGKKIRLSGNPVSKKMSCPEIALQKEP